MYIQCQNCGCHQEVSLRLFANILGAATAGFGWFGWTTFLFAGTGLAMPICIAIIAGGAAMLKYSDEIAAWLSKMYPCPKCGANNWRTITEDELKLNEIRRTSVTIEEYNEINIFPAMRQMYAETEKCLYLAFPWYNLKYVKDDFPMLLDAKRRGVGICVFYGIMPEKKEYRDSDQRRACRTLQAIDWLKRNLGKDDSTDYISVHCHIKYMWNEKYTIFGSHNLFSYRPDKCGGRAEMMKKCIGAKAVEDGFNRITSLRIIENYDGFAYRGEECFLRDEIRKYAEDKYAS